MMQTNGWLRGATIFFLFILMLACTGNSTNDEDNQQSEVSNSRKNSEGVPVFESEEHDFGEISLNEEVGARFGFKNEGGKPLHITRVATSCGCTVAEYSSEPVLPGESGFVEIIFDSRGKRGAQFQDARVYFEGKNQPVRLSIVAQVIKK